MLSLLDMKRVVGHVGAPSANNYVIHLSVWETGTSIENNTSTVKYKMWITADNDKYITEYDGATKYMSGWSVDGAQLRATINLAGKQVAQTTGYYTLYWNRSNQNSAELIAEGSVSVAHNADGNLNMSISATLEQLNNYAANPSNGSISTSGPLEYIPRASTATLNKTSLTADGSSVTLTISKANSGFTSTLTWKYGNSSDTLLNKSSAGSATFTPNPASLYGQGTSGKVYFYLTTYNGSTQIGDTQTYSVNLTIPAVSTIRATDANIGAVSQLTVTRNSTAYTHSIRYALSNSAGYVKADGGNQSTEVKLTATSIGFSNPTAFYAQIPNAKTGKVTLQIKTYYGNSQVGSTQTAEYTVTAANSAPTISGITIADQNSTTIALTGNASRQVRYYSNTKVSFTASARNSASVSATSIGGVSTGATGSPSRTFNGFGGGDIALAVTDSRGYGATGTASPTMVNYVKLTTNHRVYRPQPTDGTARIVFSGDYWAGNFGAVANTLTLRYRWKPVGGAYSSWVNVTASVSGGKYTATVNLTGFNYQQSFQFNLSIADKLISFNVEDNNALLRAGEPVYNWGKKDFQFNVPVTLPFSNSTSNGIPIAKRLYSSGDVSSKRWVRVAKYKLNTTNYIGPFVMNLHIARRYNYNAPEAYEVCVTQAWEGQCRIVQTCGVAYGKLLEHVTLRRDETNHYAYIEIYYNGTSSNTIEVVIDVENNNTGSLNGWEACFESGGTGSPLGTVVLTNGTSVQELVIGGHSSAIGTEVMGSGSVSAGNNVWYRVASVTLTAGVWVIFGYVSRNTTTNQFASVLEENGNGNITRQTQIDGGVYIHSSKIWALTESTTIYVRCWQNSGSTLTVGGYVHAARIA